MSKKKHVRRFRVLETETARRDIECIYLDRFPDPTSADRSARIKADVQQARNEFLAFLTQFEPVYRAATNSEGINGFRIAKRRTRFFWTRIKLFLRAIWSCNLRVLNGDKFEHVFYCRNNHMAITAKFYLELKAGRITISRYYTSESVFPHD